MWKSENSERSISRKIVFDFIRANDQQFPWYLRLSAWIGDDPYKSMVLIILFPLYFFNRWIRKKILPQEFWRMINTMEDQQMKSFLQFHHQRLHISEVFDMPEVHRGSDASASGKEQVQTSGEPQGNQDPGAIDETEGSSTGGQQHAPAEQEEYEDTRNKNVVEDQLPGSQVQTSAAPPEDEDIRTKDVAAEQLEDDQAKNSGKPADNEEVSSNDADEDQSESEEKRPLPDRKHKKRDDQLNIQWDDNIEDS